ncbi:hypothetical protein niasHT_017660 [Heterodera trifolii]|uniref:RUN domain-containing protein n=1 Tax=Heterodera trifolii TaxID=157864 RepID=A0ABD2L8H1_9BILA
MLSGNEFDQWLEKMGIVYSPESERVPSGCLPHKPVPMGGVEPFEDADKNQNLWEGRSPFKSLIIYTYNLVSKISAHNAVGKEGKFHLFILFSLRDHILSGLLPLIAWTQVTSQLYDQSAFLRQPSKLSYLSKLISTLNEFHKLQVLEHRVGIAVNALTKHFLTSTDKDQQSRNAKLSTLLCSEDGGLLPSLDGIL